MLDIINSITILYFPDHNMSHVYVKGYLIPDKSKSTKRKTALHKLQRIDPKESSNDNVTSWNSEEAEREKPRDRKMSQRLVSTLKRGTRSSQKKKEQDLGENLYRA